jgi:hypothetical protein
VAERYIMANKEHLARLKQGVKAWNAWWNEGGRKRPALRGAALRRANLIMADLYEPKLSVAILRGASITMANLTGANLFGAFLNGADLTEALLNGANLAKANLTRAHLRRANLRGADHRDAILHEANFSEAEIGWTSLGNVDLSMVQGLDTAVHRGPSTIGLDTLYRSHGNIPEVFLHGAGVPDDMITYIKSLVGRPFEFYSCFISYSSRDEALAQRLYADLQDKGVHCWFAPEDLKIGDEFRSRIDESIQVYDRLLLILSESSVKSRWVQKEVETAFEK